MTEPHYLRFARALALVGSIGGASAGCGMATTPSGTDGGGGTTDTGSPQPDTGTTVDDAAIADAGIETDAYLNCDMTMCSCGLTATDAGLPECDIRCCAAVGPLAPPNLPALA
ncbi:MAG: hypothetical protein U0234_20340 [Sandaracinus sp.]